jgi:hypothetical protein
MGVIVYEDPQGGVTDWQTPDENLAFDDSTGHWLVTTSDGDTVRRIPRERVFYVETKAGTPR